MKPQIGVVTLGVDDLDRSLAFYRDGLGLPTEGISGDQFQGDDEHPAGAVVMFHLKGGLVLALYPRSELAKDARVTMGVPGSAEFSLGYLAAGKGEVDQVVMFTAVLHFYNQIHRPMPSERGMRGFPRGAEMSIVLNPKFPAPDRSGQSVKLQREGDGCIDLGWCEGVLFDGRPFRAETWVQDQITMVTIFFSAIGIEDVNEAQLSSVMESEGLVKYRDGVRRRKNECHIITDGAGNAMWSVNIPVGVGDETFVASVVPYFAYDQDAAPPTLFRKASSAARDG